MSTSGRWLALIPILLPMCGCDGNEVWTCPDPGYVPTGPVITDACECEQGVPFFCYDACDGPADFTCEDPARLAEFLAVDCAGCYLTHWSQGSRLTAIRVSECGDRRY